MSPPGVKEADPQLDFNAQVALGQKLSPQAAWLQIKSLVDAALENYPDESQKLDQQYNLPIDSTNLEEWLELMNPVKGLNEFHYINPGLSLKNIPQLPPLKVYEGVVRILTVSDRYNSLK